LKLIFVKCQAYFPVPTAEQPSVNLDEFSRKWDSQLPSISFSWRNNRERVTPLFSSPPEIRKVIYTTNAIE